jgi:hypothetical protein
LNLQITILISFFIQSDFIKLPETLIKVGGTPEKTGNLVKLQFYKVKFVVFKLFKLILDKSFDEKSIEVAETESKSMISQFIIFNSSN